MSLISRDYRCPNCESVTNKLVPRNEDPQIIECPECGASAGRTISVPNVTAVSHVDGTDRWGGVKEKRKLDKLAREARLKGDSYMASKIKHEQAKLGDSNRRSKKAEAPVKKEPFK